MSDASHDEASTTDSSDEDDDDILDVNGGRAAWIDSDDERLEISLVDSNRLKKLRKNGGEDIVTGKEYVKRLRTRFESTQSLCGHRIRLPTLQVRMRTKIWSPTMMLQSLLIPLPNYCKAHRDTFSTTRQSFFLLASLTLID